VHRLMLLGLALGLSAHADGEKRKKKVIIKVGMVGESNVGKTSLVVKYTEGSFSEDYIQTLGTSCRQDTAWVVGWLRPSDQPQVWAQQAGQALGVPGLAGAVQGMFPAGAAVAVAVMAGSRAEARAVVGAGLGDAAPSHKPASVTEPDGMILLTTRGAAPERCLANL